MSGDNSALIPRTGIVPRLTAGPKTGQRSLYQQQVLDEDAYTEALSTIITRDFFPNLPHIHATNAYLTALTNNDPELLSASIRRLAALAREKEEAKPVGGSGKGDEDEAKASRWRELENVGTPYISIPGGRAPLRTPVGARGWDTPVMRAGEGSTRRRPLNTDDELDELDGDPGATPASRPLRPAKKRRPAPPLKRVRDDLTLDAFQRNYTSEDNASFVQIVDEENKRRREDRWAWAFDAEEKAEHRRLQGEERRKTILDAATRGGWMVNGEGTRLIGGLAEGGKDRAEGEAWSEKRLLTAASQKFGAEEQEGVGSSSIAVNDGALVQHSSSSGSSSIVRVSEGSNPQMSHLTEVPIPSDHPLNKALADAGLPTTALVSVEDGSIVPQREMTSGSGEGRGRGDEDKNQRMQTEKAVVGYEEREHFLLGGSGADQWNFTARNKLYFPADADSNPYPKSRKILTTEAPRQAPPAISHANTRLPDDDEVGPVGGKTSGSRRGSSPARSWVDAAVNGTPYRPSGESSMPKVNNYSLLPNDPSPSPTELPSLLTWGTLLSTPRALDANDDPLDLSQPSFRMPEGKRRDEIGRRLADKASRSMNARAAGFTPRPNTALRNLADRTQRSVRGEKTPGKMLPPISTPRRESLTPAGKRLLERSIARTPVTQSGKTGLAIGTSGRNRGAAMEQGSGWGGLGAKAGLGGRAVGSMSWTPSPGHRRG